MIFDTEPGMTSPLRKRAIPFEGKADGKAGRMRYCLPLRGEGGRQSRPDEVGSVYSFYAASSASLRSASSPRGEGIGGRQYDFAAAAKRLWS